ncbi:hypothetical protein [Paraliobacillus zengyii]|uniref:hypothetical protein n=1 Tax=Paraliobacillus zengyii TaxID=2213194 RepID=UPI000E3B71DE|nr:hypothetical protein [Paraliobacillus zengyii]
MKKCMSINESMVDLKSNTRKDMKFIESHREFNNKNHDFELVYGKFSYNLNLVERAKYETDWFSFKNYIAYDFSNLKYPPCHLYVDRNDVIAIWFTPNDLVITGINKEDEKTILTNMEHQLGSLSLCTLKELFASEGDRQITEELYLEEYYRKNQYKKILLPNPICESKVVIGSEGK